MRSLPPLNALRAFEAAARHQSFQLAANELHVTPTAISHQIRHLEELLGCALFQRRPRPVRLTSAGQQLFPALRDGLDRIATAVTAVRTATGRGPLIVTTTPAFASRWLIPRLGALREACGGCGLAVEASEAVLDLHAGEADFAIRYARSPDPELECHPLFRDRYVPVCSPALLRSGKLKTPADLANHTLIHFQWKREDPAAPTWRCWASHAQRLFPGAPLPDTDTGLRFSEENHAIEAALLGQGIALLSEVLVSQELTNGMLIRALDLPIDGMTFYAMYPADTSRRESIERLVDLIRGSHA
ncbi:MAG TPA: LysR substrate-binding domain-containing protein [Gammaproteobacteria bacterium]|nr:LysR substrate-binding domain-containing protein [Gammaproteobacteria bacterium]